MKGAALRQADDSEEAPPQAAEQLWPESELQFYTRRALEERRLANMAPTAAAAAAHLYLAASYSAKMAEELTKQAEFEKLALRIKG